jgi:hypothetical protein
MAIQLGSAYGKVALDVRDLLSGVKKGQEGLFTLANVGQQVGDAMKNVGAKLTIGLTLPIAALGAASIKAASDFEETKNKALVVFDEMGDAVVENANRAAATLGVSKTQYLDYASAIGAALKAGGMGIQESAELAEGAVKHFADLASFHNARVEDVALAWQSAIRGQYEPIQKYFPFITNQYLITYGTANGLIDANTTTLTANQRAIILNAIALNEELNPALDDFAETSGGLANQTRILKAQWNDALILLGQNLLPIALRVVSAFNSLLEKFNQLTPVQQKMVLGFLGFLAILGPVLSGIGTIVSVVSSISGALGVLSTAGVSLSGIGTLLTGAVVPAVAAAGAAIGAALLPILAILASLIFFVGVFAAAWTTNFLNIRTGTQAAIKIITSLWRAFTAFLRGDTDEALAHLQEAWDTFVAHVQSVFSKFDGLRTAWLNFLGWVQGALTRFVEYVANVFQNMDWGQLGRYLVLGLINGMLGGIPLLIVAAARVAESALEAIKRTLGITSPSKAFEELGRFSGQGFQLGLARAMAPEDIARSMARPVNQLATSNQQNLTIQMASGVTIRDARGMIADSEERIMNSITNLLGG